MNVQTSSLALRLGMLTLCLVAIPLAAAGQMPFAAMSDGGGEPNPLPNLPRPADQPASLFSPTPPAGALRLSRLGVSLLPARPVA